MSTLKRLLILTIVICSGQLVKANDGEYCEKNSPEVSVQGCVMDAITRKPVTGVTVSVSSNNLSTGKQVHSDAAGHFTFAKLPPGNVRLMFTKKGYKIFKSNLLPVKEGSTAKISVDFQPVDEGGGDIWRPLLKLLD